MSSFSHIQAAWGKQDPVVFVGVEEELKTENMKDNLQEITGRRDGSKNKDQKETGLNQLVKNEDFRSEKIL